MIRSKIDAAKERRNKACSNLESALATQRGTSEARTEAILRRQQAKTTGKCSCCGSEGIGGNGLCKNCDAATKRMLAFKSSLSSEWPREKRLRRFIEDYRAMPNPPYALRGCVEREELLAYAEELLDAVVALNCEVKRTETRRFTSE